MDEHEKRAGVITGPRSDSRNIEVSSMDTLHSVIGWCRREYYPCRSRYREKGPKLEDWQELRITAETAGRYFNGARRMWACCEGPSGAADVDLDSREALIAFPDFAPETGLIFGARPSPGRTGSTGWIPPCRSVRYIDPVDHQTPARVPLPRRRTVRSASQTIVPPSVHLGRDRSNSRAVSKAKLPTSMLKNWALPVKDGRGGAAGPSLAPGAGRAGTMRSWPLRAAWRGPSGRLPKPSS